MNDKIATVKFREFLRLKHFALSTLGVPSPMELRPALDIGPGGMVLPRLVMEITQMVMARQQARLVGAVETVRPHLLKETFS